MCTLTQQLQRAGLLLVLSSTGYAYGSEAIVNQLPSGWTPLAASAPDTGLSLSGTFQRQGRIDKAVVVQNGQGEAYGLAVVPVDGTASIVKTFKDIKANPPHLSLVQPGSYQPVCHDGHSCAPLSIATESIGLCFGEASCEIIYFSDGAYHEIYLTD